MIEVVQVRSPEGDVFLEAPEKRLRTDELEWSLLKTLRRVPPGEGKLVGIYRFRRATVTVGEGEALSAVTMPRATRDRVAEDEWKKMAELQRDVYSEIGVEL